MKIDISSFRSIRVLVVGDLMLDRYWSGPTSRISPEAPVLVVQVAKVEERPGGAGNVALNLAALGAQVELLSYCGQDEAGDRLIMMLCDAGITCHVQRVAAIHTTMKLRVLSVHQQLLRLDFEEAPPSFNIEQLTLDFECLIQAVDLVIFSDYAKGCLQNIERWISCARQANKPIFVDPKCNDLNVYQGATVLTPNRREFERMVGPCANEQTLVKKARTVLASSALEALLITRGEQGMTLVQRDQPTMHLPAFAQQVYDVTGAGDTVVACLALAYQATQKELFSAAKLANIAAGLVVGKLGAATIDPAELTLAAATKSTSLQTGRLSAAALQTVVNAVKAQGKKIVMTSGCFDILHAGHVSYLTEAKALGDYLIVAVNDDASIKRLKGGKRPIHTLDQRIKVLAGLSAVDWLVSFNDTTSERLIACIQPDVWVKGSDYQLSELPEARVVQHYGGEVKLLDLLKGCSTTAVLAALKNE